MPRARVILTTYNGLSYLRRAVRGYLRQTTQDFSLVIADDGSTPDTGAFVGTFAQAAARRGVAVEHVWHEDEGFRRAAILNEAVRRGRDETLFVFSDQDCIPPATFVERHLAAHGPLSFAVAGAVRLSRDVSEAVTEADVEEGRYEGLIAAVHRKELRRRARKTRWGTLVRRRRRPKVLGLNIGMDRGLFEAINGFDERFVGYGFEDDDLRDRAMRHRPRPRVRNLYGKNDVFHLWHPENAVGREPNRSYYESRRPLRCEVGLRRDAT